MTDLNWAITGGLGFLGTNLIDHMLKQGVKPENISIINNRSISGSASKFRLDRALPDSLVQHPDVSINYADILDMEALVGALHEADVIVHLAAATSVNDSIENPEHDFRVNSQGTFNVLQCARQRPRKRLIFASSVSGFSAEEIVTEHTLPDPLSPYGASKLHGEFLCKAWSGSFGLPVTVLRLTNAYGPRFASNFGVVSQAIRAAISGEEFKLFGTGDASRDFVFAGDISEAFLRAARSENNDGYQLYQIASGVGVSVNMLLETINGELEKRGYDALKVSMEKARPGEIKASCGSSRKAELELGWSPQTSLEDGIGQTIDWYIQQIKNPI